MCGGVALKHTNTFCLLKDAACVKCYHVNTEALCMQENLIHLKQNSHLSHLRSAIMVHSPIITEQATLIYAGFDSCSF